MLLLDLLKCPDEDLIKYAWPQDVWFYVDKLCSAHVYLRLPESITSCQWEAIPDALLVDCDSLCAARQACASRSTLSKVSQEQLLLFLVFKLGNKSNDLTIIYTPADYLKVRALPTLSYISSTSLTHVL